ncbi:MAG: sugar ABC transporter permease [Desulfuromonas sp.]|nr:sugar ABC transporter permease [Desulfuromonas sp.]
MKRELRDHEGRLAAVMLLPVVLYIVLLVGFPFLMAFAYSLSNVTVGSPDFRIVGLGNFLAIFADQAFRTALFNTFVFTFCSITVVVVFGHILAELLRQEFRGKWLVRFLLLLPWTTPIALGTIGFLWYFDSLYSPIDWFLRQTGFLGHHDAPLGPRSNLYWLGRPGLAMFAVITVHIWRLLPLAAMIMLAGMNGIPKEIVESARVDGAGYFRRLFEIVLPLLFPVVAVTILFATFFTFTDMTVVWILTKGGPPPNATQVLASLAFLNGIEGGDLAKGAATAIFFFPVLAGLAALVLRLVKKAVVI